MLVIFPLSPREGGAKVYAFEPVDTVFLQLKKVKELNQFLDITVEEKAVGHRNRRTVMRMWRNQKSPGSYLPREDFEQRILTKEGVEIEVPMIAPDSYVAERKISRIDVMKIDVEGWERFVLQGAKESIGKYRPVIICEISSELYDVGATIDLIGAIRKECGYKIQFPDGTVGDLEDF